MGRKLILASGIILICLLQAAFWLKQSTESIPPSLPEIPELIISTYHSLAAEGGLGAVLFPAFEKKYNCKLRVMTSGESGELLTRLETDAQKGKFQAQIILGINQTSWQTIWARAKPLLEDWQSWTPDGYEQIPAELKIASGFLPYDYSALTFMVDLESFQKLGLPEPHSILDLSRPEWARNLLLEDPRTSTPGLSFLIYSKLILGDSVWEFWKNIRKNWLTLAPSWDFAYGLFLKGEAPLVWSYLTSQAYHDFQGHGKRYAALLLKEGQPIEVEGAALLRGSFVSDSQRTLAKKFLEFLISPEIQRIIPHHSWMMPVLKNIELPEDFVRLPQGGREIWPSAQAPDAVQILKEWRKAIESQ